MEDKYGNVISSLAEENDKKIVLLVMDGIGDCDNNEKGTALEIANTPNLDKLAEKSALGQIYPVAPAITPGSGPGHLGLFGYDPLIYKVGRGVLSALGVEFKLKKGDIAARLNFCTLDENGKVADRRAGRISTGENQRILKKVKDHISTPPGIELFLETVSEHRVLMVLRGEDLDDDVPDTDPQETNVTPIDPTSGSKESKTAKIVKELLNQVKDILKDESKANFFLARGFAQLPNWPSFKERYKLNPAAVAGYPMYRGVSRLLGIPVVYESKTANEVCKDITRAMKEHTFVFGHFKYTDKTGEDGDLAGKIKVIEEMDQALSILLDHKPDVLIVTGDHSTPPSMKAHSWHPVPVLLHAPYTRHVKSGGFNEKSCLQGEIGTIYAKELLPLAMAHATKLQKYGA